MTVMFFEDDKELYHSTLLLFIRHRLQMQETGQELWETQKGFI
jgi:hypothetical protein